MEPAIVHLHSLLAVQIEAYSVSTFFEVFCMIFAVFTPVMEMARSSPAPLNPTANAFH